MIVIRHKLKMNGWTVLNKCIRPPVMTGSNISKVCFKMNSFIVKITNWNYKIIIEK